jgi:hypothetical protein
MNNRTLIAVFVVCFLLTVAFVSIRRGDWNRADSRGPAPTSGSGASGAAPPARAAVAQAPTANGPPYKPAADADAVEPARAPAYPDHSQADAPRDPAAMEVPVIVTVEDSPATGRREAIIRNLSPQPLDVSVTAIKPGGARSTVQASIPPRRRTNLTEQGLIVVTGSQILVESPPYLQQSTTVY